MRQEPDNEQTGINSGNGMVMGALLGVVLGPLLGVGSFGLVTGALIGLVLGAPTPSHESSPQ